MEAITSKTPLPPVAETQPVRPAGQQNQQEQPVRKDEGTARGAHGLSRADTEKLVALIQESLDSMNINISFSTYGSERERTAVIVKEKGTGNVIREIPPKELQELYMKMEELMGMIFSGRA